jgi:predicted PurR-regulated permease PerM
LIARAARVFAVAWAAVGMVILATLLLRYVLFPTRIIFAPLLLALILVYLLNPVVNWLEHRHVRRVLATLLTYAVVLTVLGVVLSWLIPLVKDQAVAFGDSIPALLQRAQDGLLKFARELGLRVRHVHLLTAFGKSGSVGEYVKRVTSISSAVGLVLVVVLGPILAFYLLVDLPKLSRNLASAVPAPRRSEALRVGRRVSAAVGGYFRGQLLIALLVGAFCMLGFWIIALPYWALVGLLIGLFSLIPVIGPFLGAIPTLFVAFTTPESGTGGLFHPRPGWPLAVAASVVLLIVQQADVLLISPRMVTRTVKLNPVTVMISVLIAGTIAGVYGMLLAIPAIASVKILVVHYWDTRMVWPPRPSEGAGEQGGATETGGAEPGGADPGPGMVAVLPEDDPELQGPDEAAPGDATDGAAGEGAGNGNGKRRPAAFSPGRLARSWRQGRTPGGGRRTTGGRRPKG